MSEPANEETIDLAEITVRVHCTVRPGPANIGKVMGGLQRMLNDISGATTHLEKGFSTTVHYKVSGLLKGEGKITIA